MKVFYLFVILIGSSSHALDRGGNHRNLLPGDNGASVKIIGREEKGKIPSTQLPDLGLNPREPKRAGKKIANGVLQDVEAFGVCKAVQNGFGEDLFIPLGSSFEWKQFRENPPNNVLITDCSLATNKCPENYIFDGEFCVRTILGKEPKCAPGYFAAYHRTGAYGGKLREGTIEPNTCYRVKGVATICQAEYKFWSAIDDCFLKEEFTLRAPPPAPAEYPYQIENSCGAGTCRFSKIDKPYKHLPTCLNDNHIEFYYSAAVTCLDPEDTQSWSCEDGFEFKASDTGNGKLNRCLKVDKVKPIEG